MKIKSLQLNQYLTWVFKKSQEIQKELQTREAYRIIALENDENGICKVKVNIVGTGKFFLCTPQEIISDDKMLEGFSKKDIKFLTYHACINLNKPTLQIIGHSFSHQLKKIIFRLRKRDAPHAEEKTADEISNTDTIIKQLSPEDAHRVGYVYGSENILMEEEAKRTSKEYI